VSDSEPEPDVTVRGPGDEPEVTVVGGVHGDEPSGVEVVRTLRDADLDLQRRVQFVVANPPAVAADERYLDSDLNRSFPGDLDGDREERLAARLCALTGDTPTLSLHATHSSAEPFALVHHDQPRAFGLAADLPLPYVVDHAAVNEGTLTACTPTVTVEAGHQHADETVETAERQARAFLRLTDALAGEPDPYPAEPAGRPGFYGMRSPVRKPADAPADAACSTLYDLRVGNFTRVPTGTRYADIEGEPLVADAPFYPVLMSECGYEDVFGYTAVRYGDDVADVPFR
jgi:predicted deacylase